MSHEITEAVLDYETRSAAELETCGAIEYAKHPSTSIFCLGYRISNGAPHIWIPERSPVPLDLMECFEKGILTSHNASFERAITTHTLPRYGSITPHQKEIIQNIPASRWRCTAAKAAACSLPRNLEMACKALGLKTQKDLAGHKLIKKYCKPRKPSKHNPNPWWVDRRDLRAIYRYCLVDVQAEYELDQALPDLTPFEQKVWELDQKINDRGVRIDIPTVKLILNMIDVEMRNITGRVQKLTHGAIESATKRAQVLEWVNARGANMANLQAATIRDKLMDESLDSKVSEMLYYRQASSKTSTAKYISMLKAVGSDDRARELLLYNGTMPTGRWSGKRIQPHNFPRPTVRDFNSDQAISFIQTGGIEKIRQHYGEHKVMDVLVSAIRGMLIPSPGCELFCSDWSAVELCLSFWVAEHVEGIRAINEGRKMYEEMASVAFDIPLEKVTKDSIERFVGKESVLGCGYGMAWSKFLNNCHMKGVPQVTDKMARKAVASYRKVHWPVPRAWKNLEENIIRAIQSPGQVFKTNKVSIYTAGDFLAIRLPSGRRLRYYKPRLSQKQLASGKLVPQIHYWTMDHFQWCEVSNWGAGFFNHVVQGIARDLMVGAAMNIENAGYSFLLSVHDEALAEKKIGHGDLDEFTALMTKLPKWANGAPIRAESWTGFRYRK